MLSTTQKNLTEKSKPKDKVDIVKYYTTHDNWVVELQKL